MSRQILSFFTLHKEKLYQIISNLHGALVLEKSSNYFLSAAEHPCSSNIYYGKVTTVTVELKMVHNFFFMFRTVQ